MGAKITKEQKYVLYALGQFHQQSDILLKEKQLQIALPKNIFIDFVMKTKLADKKERALYKNIEELEKNRFLSYDKKELILTNKGFKTFAKIQKELQPYIEVEYLMKTQNPLDYTKKAQTTFRKE